MPSFSWFAWIRVTWNLHLAFDCFLSLEEIYVYIHMYVYIYFQTTTIIFLFYIITFYILILFFSYTFFLIGLSYCCCIEIVLYIFWITYPYLIWFANIFSHSVGCLFTLVSSDAQKFSILTKSNLCFFFSCLCFWCRFKNPLPNLRSWRLNAMFVPKSFTVLALTLRYLIYFERSLYMIEVESKFILLQMDFCFSQNHWSNCYVPT